MKTITQTGKMDTIMIRTAFIYTIIQMATAIVHDEFLLVTEGFLIYQYDLSQAIPSRHYVAFDEYHSVVMGVDYDDVSEHVYWTDARKNTIHSVLLNDTQRRVVSLGKELSEITSVAVDGRSGNIYYTDNLGHSLGVIKIGSHYRKTLIQGGQGIPTYVILDKLGRYIYFSTYIEPAIKRANLDGSNITDIVTSDLTRPHGMSIDYTEGYLYWVDIDRGRVERAAIDGSNRTLLLQIPESVLFDTTVTGDYLYVIDRNHSNIYKINKFTLDVGYIDYKHFIHRGIVAFNKSEVPQIDSQCSNNVCEQFCFPSKSGYTCSCADDIPPGNNSSTCNTTLVGRCSSTFPHGHIVPECSRFASVSCGVSCDQGYVAAVEWVVCQDDLNWNTNPEYFCKKAELEVNGEVILVADNRRRKISQMHVSSGAFTDLAIPEGVLRNPSSVAYHPAQQTLYWSDGAYIGSCKLDGSNLKTVKLSKALLIYQLALDEQAEKLYFTDSYRSMVGWVNLELTAAGTIISQGLYHPWGITVDSVNGFLYVTESYILSGRILKINLRLSSLSVLYSYALWYPDYITVDPIGGYLYWIDEASERIERGSVNGGERTTVWTFHQSYFTGIYFHDEYLYIADCSNSAIHQILKNGTGHRRLDGNFICPRGPTVYLSSLGDITTTTQLQTTETVPKSESTWSTREITTTGADIVTTPIKAVKSKMTTNIMATHQMTTDGRTTYGTLEGEVSEHAQQQHSNAGVYVGVVIGCVAVVAVVVGLFYYLHRRKYAEANPYIRESTITENTSTI